MNPDVARDQMVLRQLIPRGIKDKKVLDVFRKVPRHKFIGEKFLTSAYADHPLPIGGGQTISQPYMVALMTELLALFGSEKVLEIGTGSGYQAAILAELAKEVYSTERIEDLAQQARTVLDEQGYTNIKIESRDGTLGWKEFSPYNAIIVTAGAPKIPQPLVEQLAEGGRMVIPVGSSFSQMLTLVEKTPEGIRTIEVCGCVFVPLVGKEGWSS